MLKIGDFSRVCQVTIKTLRYYDRLGLLHPAYVDSFTRHRYYSMSQVPQVNRILALKEVGLSLDEIKQILSEELSTLEVRGMLRLKQTELRAEAEAIQTRLQLIEARIQLMDQEGNMSKYEVVIKAIPAQRVLSIREVLARAEDIPSLFEEVANALKARNIQASGAWMAIYHHEGFRDTNLEIEIAVPVEANVPELVPIEDNRRLEIRETAPYEETATVIENGQNERWSGSYEALGQFMETNNYEIAGAVREVYLTSPDDEAGWLVEIQFPVKVREDSKAQLAKSQV